MAEQVKDNEDNEVESPQRFGPFKVLVGKYVGNDPDNYQKDSAGRVLKDVLGVPLLKEMVKDAGSPPFYATCDLLQYNYPGMGPKFALIGDGGQQFVTQNQPRTQNVPRSNNEQGDGLEELTNKELKQYAADNDISLDGVPERKEDIIAAIRKYIQTVE